MVSKQQTEQPFGLMEQWLSGSKGLQPQPFPELHGPFSYTHHLSGWKTHLHIQYHIQACNSITSLAHQGKILLSNVLRITDQPIMLMSSLQVTSHLLETTMTCLSATLILKKGGGQVFSLLCSDFKQVHIKIG